MSRKQQHNWATFYSPRNGRISIQACSQCGVAKSFVIGENACQEVSEETRLARLRGWSMNSPTEVESTISVG